MGLENIAIYKKKLNLTTEELSTASGVPVGTLNKILSGATKDPKLETLKAVAKVLGLSLNDFDDSDKFIETTAAHKEGENFTPEELDKIEEYKRLLLAARPKE